MKAVLSLGFLAIAGLAQAAPDSCDDYASRHYQRDLVPVSAGVTNVPRSGDIAGFQSLELGVRNAGTVAFEDHTAPGSLISHVSQLQISLTTHSIINNKPVTSTRRYTGWLRVPMKGAAQQKVSFTLPADAVQHCTMVDVVVDSNRALGQWGCAVFGNDRGSYRIHIATASGTHLSLCPYDIVHH